MTNTPADYKTCALQISIVAIPHTENLGVGLPDRRFFCDNKLQFLHLQVRFSLQIPGDYVSGDHLAARALAHYLILRHQD